MRAVVITVSDGCASGAREDLSGKLLAELLCEAGAEVVASEILSDDLEPLAERLRFYSGRGDVNLILTTGGTGLGPRDNTPEATRKAIEREAQGLAEAMRAETLKKSPTAMLSRGVCGVRARTLIVNLPGSPKGVRECFAIIRPVLAHAVSIIAGGSHKEET